MQLLGGSITKRKEKMIDEASKMANKLVIMHDAKLFAKMKAGDEKESKITDLEKKAKKLGFSRREYEEIIDKQGAYDEAVEMNLYYNTLSKERNANLWSEAKMGEDPEPVSGKKTFTKKPQSKVTINPEEKI